MDRSEERINNLLFHIRCYPGAVAYVRELIGVIKSAPEDERSRIIELAEQASARL